VTVEIKILSGANSIGGSFIRIEDGDETIIFDQGIRFDVMKKFYSSFISPRGVAELREIGALPKPEWYEGANAIYISHMHLDHLGRTFKYSSRNNCENPKQRRLRENGREVGRVPYMAFTSTEKILCRIGRAKKPFKPMKTMLWQFLFHTAHSLHIP
jgi:mRNA degradation ribonuclease J1/J2